MTLTDTAASELREALIKAAAALEVKQEPTVESVYGKPLSELTAPEGWEFTGEFRMTVPGQEEWLAPDALGCDYPYLARRGKPAVRLILRKKEPPKPTAPTCESVYGKSLEELKPLFEKTHTARMEDGKPVVRLPKAGEWCMSANSDFPQHVSFDWTLGNVLGPRLILDPLPPKPRRIIFEWVRHGYAINGDWYDDRAAGVIAKWPGRSESNAKYDIYRLVEER